jgi:hypothetical protein
VFPVRYELNSYILFKWLMCFEEMLQSAVVTMYTACFNIKIFGILLTQCIYVFHFGLTINSSVAPKQCYSTGLCNGDAVCFLSSKQCFIQFALDIHAM